MTLVKLIIAVENANHSFSLSHVIPVLYNPNQITVQKTGWSQDQHGSISKKSNPATLTVELFFDTSFLSEMLPANLGSLYEYSIDDVRNYVDRIFDLTNPKSELNNRPPICRLIWGGNIGLLSSRENYKGAVIFQGVLQNVSKRFTRFTQAGIPVRATLDCTFLEYEDPVYGAKKLNVIDDPVRVVKQGETLSSIAQEEYGNSALWRVIADANRLVNPRRLEVGSSLTVPPLPRQGGR